LLERRREVEPADHPTTTADQVVSLTTDQAFVELEVLVVGQGGRCSIDGDHTLQDQQIAGRRRPVV